MGEPSEVQRLAQQLAAEASPDERMACPLEDCGGLGGYQQLVAWVRSGYDDALLPDGFEDAAHGHSWLPVEWQPDHFDIAETNAAIAEAVADSPTLDVIEQLAGAARTGRRGIAGVDFAVAATARAATPRT